MWNDFWNYLKSGNATNNVMTSNLGAIAGNGGALWGAYNQANMAKNNFKLQQDAFNFNKMLANKEMDRRDKADTSLYNAFKTSNYGA
ncbi:hypothetical protein A9K75_07895 [Campylobacter fetus subsp. testudinum]|uniref:hypothetical protein n=1 Tax=Campylobacter fetus TaxID=196 RepID=UPI000818AE49|nr:hypothetical protein [Campylobacter fetus]OCR99239.1 hypothetical protein A9K75_07895 [Campylobacter fetus subsp. testudinum]OCS09390.1 hypothetical protein CFTD6783_08465 [Campylobacter fetus subsp. testudinum]